MKLSIIVPVYNVEKYLGRCLESVFNQKGIPNTEYEVIAINDGSLDKSWEVLKSFKKNHENLHIFSQKNYGLSAVRNKGLDFAKGKYVWFVDSDDWINEKAITIIFEIIAQQDYDFISIGTQDSDNSSPHRIIPNISNPRDFLRLRFAQGGRVWSYVLRRDFLINNNIRFVEGIYHEDSEYVPRMVYLARNCYVTNECLYTYFCNSQSITHTAKSKRSYDCIVVVKSLLNFRDKIVKESDAKLAFSKLIPCALNESIINILKCSKYERKEFNNYIYHNRDLLNIYNVNFNILYKLEYLLFSLFPKNVSGVYNVMNVIRNVIGLKTKI